MSGTLHDLDNSEYLERYPIDMNLVAANALKGMQRRWHIEFDCDGAPFVWDGAADHEEEALALARKALYWDGRHDVKTARVAICLERRS